MLKPPHIRLLPAFLACCLFLSFSSSAYAHRVNIFAWLDADQINVECTFSSGQPAKKSPVAVLDAAGKTELASAATDEGGRCTIALTDAMRKSPQGLLLQVNAGSGHLGSWTIEPEELNLAQKAGGAVPDAGRTQEKRQSDDESGRTAGREPEAETLQETLLRELSSLHREVAELRRELHKAQEPGIKEIFGGLGWIIGLCGIAAYFKRRQS